MFKNVFMMSWWKKNISQEFSLLSNVILFKYLILLFLQYESNTIRKEKTL